MRRIKDNPDIKKEDLRREMIFNLFIGSLLAILFIIWSILYSVVDAISVLGMAFFLLVPSFIANGMMVITGKIRGIPRYPIDCGKTFKDGKRILGDGKSWNGFIGGWLSGFLISASFCWYFFGLIYQGTDYSMFAQDPAFFNREIIHEFIKNVYNSDGINWAGYLLSQLFIALGSPIGDMIGSFFKRRVKRDRGEVFLFWDQNDFIIVSAAIASIWFPLEWIYWAFLILFTPLMTAFANYIGFLIGKKDVPW